MFFLHQYHEVKKITKLLPDRENMTRTDLDLPDGVRIEVTFNNGSNNLTLTTPIFSIGGMKHYRILGVENEN